MIKIIVYNSSTQKQFAVWHCQSRQCWRGCFFCICLFCRSNSFSFLLFFDWMIWEMMFLLNSTPLKSQTTTVPWPRGGPEGRRLGGLIHYFSCVCSWFPRPRLRAQSNSMGLSSGGSSVPSSSSPEPIRLFSRLPARCKTAIIILSKAAAKPTEVK